MKKTGIISALILFSMLAYGQETQKSYSFVENEFIIWLEQGVDAATFAVNANENIIPKRLLSKRLNIWLFEITDNIEKRDAKMNNLSRSTHIKHIQNNHTNITLRESTPNDPSFSQQWAPEKMSLPQAWAEYTTGGFASTGDTIVVAVIDGGAYLNHTDLSFWKNNHEIPNNGIDDDNNGYIDDFHGWNAFTHSGNVTSDSHGTHVSGIIGAIGNNGTGVCGVNWNVKILPIRGSTGLESIAVEAYSYALEMRAAYNETNGEQGAFIVATNSSFGVDYGNPNNYPIWCSMYEEMGNVGMLSCVAGPNANVNIDVVGDVPATCPSEFVIGITNTTSADIKNTGAGHGINNIDIGAPGTNIYSTELNNSYSNKTGTSMATPHVAGVIALMYAAMPENMIQAYKNDPANFALSVKQYLLDGADSIPALDGLVASSRRLNAYGAIYQAINNFTVPALSGTIGILGNAVFGETLTVDTTALTSTPNIILGALQYQWIRNTTPISGADNSTYTLVEADIDQVINVQVSAANCTGTITSTNTETVTKAEQTAPDAPTLDSATSTRIILVAASDYEYNMDGGAWQSLPVFENLTSNTSYAFTQRKAETATHLASPESQAATFKTNEGVGINENLLENITVYPNPTTGELRIGSGKLKVNHIEIFDIYGRNVGAQFLSDNLEECPKEEVVLNISHLPTGFYFVKICTETGEVAKKILKE